MGSYVGQSLQVSFFGESHGQALGCTIDGLPAGSLIDVAKLQEFLNRRRPGSSHTSPRKEPDKLEFIAGCKLKETPEGIMAQSTGSPLTALVYNQDMRSQDYEKNSSIMRPGHADLTAYQRFHGYQDTAGSGHFSGRISLAYCIAGGIAKQILEQKNISTHAHILQCGDIRDIKLDPLNLDKKQVKKLSNNPLPCIRSSNASKLTTLIEQAKLQHNSYGALVECVSYGFPAGIGSGHFAGIDSAIAQAIFGIPGIKSLEFGMGRKVSQLTGLQNNDIPYYDEEGLIRFKTNNAGGILGGISTGAPIIISCGVKPTPSIAHEQSSIDITTGRNVTTSTEGRHDPCIALRIVPVVEAMVSLALLDALLSHVEAKPALLDLNIKVAPSNMQSKHPSDTQDETAAGKNTSSEGGKDAPNESTTAKLVFKNPYSKNKEMLKRFGSEISPKTIPVLKDGELQPNFIKLSQFRTKSLLIRPTTHNQELLDSCQAPLYSLSLPQGRYGLVGKTLKHSYSPEIYFQLAGLNYELFELEEAMLKPFMQEGDWQGLSITTPYKASVIPWVDELSPEALRLGNINVCKKDAHGRIIGHNTDYFGFSESFKRMMLEIRQHNKDHKRYLPKQLRALILGTGGAAQTVKAVLEDEGIIVNCLSPSSDPGMSEISQFFNAHILVNASPVGTFPHTHATPLDGYANLRHFIHLRAVIDLTYNPLTTRLMNRARKLHIPIFSGMDMLVYQAFAALEFFGDEKLDIKCAHDLCAYMNEKYKFSRWSNPSATGPHNTEPQLCKL